MLAIACLCPPLGKVLWNFLAFKHGGRDVFVCFCQSLFATTRLCLPPLAERPIGCAYRTLISVRTWRLRKQSFVDSRLFTFGNASLARQKRTVFERPPQPSHQRKAAAEVSATRDTENLAEGINGTTQRSNNLVRMLV